MTAPSNGFAAAGLNRVTEVSPDGSSFRLARVGLRQLGVAN
ncbi:hypothetical protein I552_6979 [Mycobacterium xenopi 3993]|nr:hypothetical protein I552_6979 [Mycobacterium xenopi 3993]